MNLENWDALAAVINGEALHTGKDISKTWSEVAVLMFY
jgi:hypothetical protein